METWLIIVLVIVAIIVIWYISTLNKLNRTLVKITLEDAAKADEMLK